MTQSNSFGWRTVIWGIEIILMTLIGFSTYGYAHQPRLVVGKGRVDINDPEASQAFYGELRGQPDKYYIESSVDFRLYVGLLVPDTPGVSKDVSAEIARILPSGKKTVALLDGRKFQWTPFFEEFAKDNYLWGPEFKASDSQKGVVRQGGVVSAGSYEIQVFSPSNKGRYVLAIGDREEFPLKEVINAVMIMPRVKAQFFGESPLRILASPFGFGIVFVMYALAFTFGLVYRAILRQCASHSPRRVKKNIDKTDRAVRSILGVVLLVLAVTASWSPVLLFFSGFCLFEAIFSWCGFYAAIGRSTCPLP